MASRTNLRSLPSIIDASTDGLASIRRFARYLRNIQSVVDATLPESAHGTIRVADCSNGRLLLLAPSGTWATRVRYQQAVIARCLAQQLRLGIDRLEVRVRPQPQAVPAAVAWRRMDADARRLLHDCAACVDDNPALATALERLAAAGRDMPTQAAATGRALT